MRPIFTSNLPITISGIEFIKRQIFYPDSLKRWTGPFTATFAKNLDEKDNFLDDVWTEKIWLPHLMFSNTDVNKRISANDEAHNSVVVEIIRKGQ